VTELLIAIIAAMLGYFLTRLDSIEKKLDLVENQIIRYFAKRKNDLL